MLGPRHRHRNYYAPPHAVNVSLFLLLVFFWCSVSEDVDAGNGVAQVGTLASYLGCRVVLFRLLYLSGLTGRAHLHSRGRLRLDFHVKHGSRRVVKAPHGLSPRVG